ncbi:hypothetical protein GCM10018785_19020 [Streptomyces longispororuber]|uniref:Uncharacterized protein n=1 Tax=Streptomyces longispororuber TaxID=68230 RepID=A0A919DI55_9ACTN|nr:hypothetical protein [Streptomyces longispororuber]GHE49698.1 hypothetical protein GCM10018785_19020 [Streptomyces longispororuber]
MRHEQHLSRRGAVSLVVGAAAASALSGPVAAARSRPVTARLAPSNLHFEITHRFRPVHVIPPRLVQYDTERPGGRAALERVRSGDDVRTDERPVAPWASVVLDVRRLTADGSVTMGLQAVDGDAVRVRYDAGPSRVSVEVVRSGAVHVMNSTEVLLTAPFRLAFVVTANAVGAFSAGGGYDAGIDRPWQPLLTDRGGVADMMDLNRPAQLHRLHYAFGGEGAALGRVQAGPFGQFGLRDVSLVRNADGTPYVDDEGALHFTATSSGVGYAHQAHTSMWRMDPADPTRMEQVGSHFFSYEGLLMGNHGGQLVRDADRGRFIALACGGNLPKPGVTIRHGSGGQELLSGVHLIRGTRVDLPFQKAAWDPALRLIEGRWHWAYVNVTDFQPALRFRPVLAVAAPGGDYHDGVRIRKEDDYRRNNNEGCRLQQFGDRWYLLTSDPESKQYVVRDMDMRPHRRLDAPYPLGTPFPEVFPLTDRNGRKRWLMVTSDGREYEEGSAHPVLGYGVHGDVVVMRAAHE